MHCQCRQQPRFTSHVCVAVFAEANVLSYLATAKPLVTSSHEATGYCLHPAGDGHLFVKPCMPLNAANPAWRHDASTSQIQLKGSNSPSLCLSGSQEAGATVAACLVGASERQWQLTPSRQLRSASGVCVGLRAAGDLAAVACGSANEAVWSFGGESTVQPACSSAACVAWAHSQTTVGIGLNADSL